jgi:hypothetical protein
MNKTLAFPFIDTIISSLQSVVKASPVVYSTDGAPPSEDILEARLRAKMYGAEVITYRHFLRMVLNSRYEHPVPNAPISQKIIHYAVKCVQAMLYSTQAFWNVKGGRLIVTNVWGTSHG